MFSNMYFKFRNKKEYKFGITKGEINIERLLQFELLNLVGK